MRVVYSFELKKEGFGSPVLTLGNFDGVHSGHQDILLRLKSRAQRLSTKSVVYTFEPHPLKVVAPHKSPMLLTSLEEKIALIDSFGIDLLICADFTSEFARQHPEEFVKEILVEKIGVREVMVGHDYTFGKGKAGNTVYLRELGERFSFDVKIIPPFKVENVVVSSSIIRKKILDGDVNEAKRLLGRYYSFYGKVEKGDGRGRSLGFPTANLSTFKELLPKRGVYAVYVRMEERYYKGVMNIGFKPTFQEEKLLSLEVHIIGLREDVYGESLEVLFVERLREEEAFRNTNLLSKKIKGDIEKAEALLKAEMGGYTGDNW